MEKMLKKLRKILKKLFQKNLGTNFIYKLFFGEESIARLDLVMELSAKYVDHVIQKERNLLCTKDLR